MKSIIKFVLIVLIFSIQQSAVALDKNTSVCKSLLIDISRLDSLGKRIHNKYSKEYLLARKSNSQTENVIQTRTLLELYENDRSLFLRALENRKCFTKTELLNLEESLRNIDSYSTVVKSWLDAKIGLPGRNFYQSYLELPKFLATPQEWQHCERRSKKYKDLICNLYNGKLRWVSSKIPVDSAQEVTWPTGFIEGQVNLIEAKIRIVNYFDENSRVFSSSGEEAVDFMKKTSYPGLFDFNSEPMITQCTEYKNLQDRARPILVKYFVSVEEVKPDPDFVIVDGSRGQQILNTKLGGQVFSVPVRLEISKGDYSEPGSVFIRRISIINGDVYRISAC